MFETKNKNIKPGINNLNRQEAAYFFKPNPVSFSLLHRKCAECEEEEKLNRKETSSDKTSVSNDNENYINSLNGKGNELSSNEKSFFESKFGYDFSDVRVHTDSTASQSAKDLNALAYTHENNIVFGSNQYQSNTDSGKRLLAHELTHVIQQGGILKTKKIQKQSATTADPEQLRRGVLEPLDRSDAMGFLSRLRGLSQADATILAADDVFFQRIHRTFHGSAYWSVFNILYFNNRTHDPFLRLDLALYQRDATLVADTLNLIVNRPEFSQLYRNRLLVAVNEIFTGIAQRNRITQIINNPTAAGRTRDVSHYYEEAHYEIDAAGTGTLTVFGLNMALTLYNTGTELRVIVKLRFVNGTDASQLFYFLGTNAPILESWLTAIRDRWNNKFSFTNGGNTLQLVFVPMVLNEDPTATEIRILTDESQHCTDTVARGGANCWYTTWNGNTVAHEFGHLIGASDEYALPATAAEISAARPTMTQEDIDLSNYQSITGERKAVSDQGYTLTGNLMSDKSNDVYARHIQRLLSIFNSGLPAGTTPYRVQTR